MARTRLPEKPEDQAALDLWIEYRDRLRAVARRTAKARAELCDADLHIYRVMLGRRLASLA
jgi:hypothetical protein